MKNLVKFSLVVGCILVTGKVVEKVASKKLKEKVEDINKETNEFNEKIEENNIIYTIEGNSTNNTCRKNNIYSDVIFGFEMPTY